MGCWQGEAVTLLAGSSFQNQLDMSGQVSTLDDMLYIAEVPPMQSVLMSFDMQV